ncbi:MAG TPA: DNA polymerase I [Bacteroidales bacterium]|nr:DNA polymerase I [Bacteroidales bacterium]HRZ48235.1 DNA polymerase I [Bacteroidales bacterium]
MPEKRLFLLDAMALIYRAYFAMSKAPRINSKGMNTSAVLGFTNTLLDVLKNERPTHLAVAFDSYAPTVRHAEFADYKATRQSMPEDLALSIPWVKKVIEAFRIPILEKDGFEADDIIGTLARMGEEHGFEVFMMTPDKDFGQLVTDRIKIYKPARMGSGADIVGVADICKKYGIEKPEQVIDILALWGDASDNIPGIPGIGEVTASKLIGSYGSLENLLEHTEELKGKLKENIENFREQGLLSKKLATIITDVPVPFNEAQLVVEEPDRKMVTEVFGELEFRTLAARVLGEGDIRQAPVQGIPSGGIQTSLFDTEEGTGFLPEGMKVLGDLPHSYHHAEGVEGARDLAARLSTAGRFCFDTETTGLDVLTAELVGISFAVQPGEAWFLHLPEKREEVMEILDLLKPVFEDPRLEKIAQNLKYDLQILKNYGIEVQEPMFDTMVAHYLLQPEMRHNMDFLAETYLHYSPVSFSTLTGVKGKTPVDIRKVDKEYLKDYACEDADITLQLANLFIPKLKDAGAEDLFRQVEVPLIPVLAEMERTGVQIDVAALQEYSVQLGEEIRQVEELIYSYAGSIFNIASPRQLGEILFDRLRIISSPKKTKTKQYSTGEEVLGKLVHHHPIVPAILEYRSLTKLKSTYVDTFPLLIHPKTGRIHTSYNQAVTATGRLSSNNPNLQNIPIRTDRGKEIRKAFIAGYPGWELVSADYSQIELRIIAHLSGDLAMQEAFRQGMDIHTATAAGIYGVSPEMVDGTMRRNAKMVNFGIIYGISAFGLAERLNISRMEAAAIIDGYFKQYPGIKAYMERCIVRAREAGFVETMLGRRRYLRDINSANTNIRQFAERNAINAPIQGTSADMIKKAMIAIYREMETMGLRSKMIMQVHDELVFEVPLEEMKIVKPLIINGMKNAIRLDVPVEAEINSGSNWLEAH